MLKRNEEVRRLLTTDEVAEYLHCHRHTVKKLTQQGYFPCYPLGNKYRYKLADIDAYLANYMQVAGEPANPNVN